jgi:mitochondrial import inner membrane translocase subunit TIM44
MSKFWSNFSENNPLTSSMNNHMRITFIIPIGWNNFKKRYDESNNVFVYFSREITDRVGDKISSLFAETDTARAMRELKERDPNFNIENFTKTAREYIIPEILDAFLTADIPTLRLWCSEGTFNVLKANFEAQLKPGVVFSGKVLDLRNLEVNVNYSKFSQLKSYDLARFG